MGTNSVSILRQDLLFEGLGKEIPVGRYHSWVVSREGFPDCLEITAESQEGQIMAIRHKTIMYMVFSSIPNQY